MRNIHEIIARFFQGQASQDELKKLDQWLDDDKNAHEFADLHKLWSWSGQAADKKPAVPFSETWEKIQPRQTGKNNQAQRFNSFFILRYAAIAFLVLNLGWWGSHFFYQKQNQTAKQDFSIRATPYANSIVTLPDQTMVCLRPGSTLDYDNGFNANKREVLLNGEAYFDVTRQTDKPFIVKTDLAQIKVLGTKFNVSAQQGAPIYQTTLVEGQVEFQPNSGKKYLLQPNQMLELNTQKNTVTISEVNTNLYVAWKDGKLIFRNETLGNITKQLEKIYHVQFIYQNTKLADSYRFSGTIHRETSIGEVIKMLKISIPMEVERKERFPEPDLIYLK
ncbi:FecR family protein [Sunxiuqinia rutila]|uniref:FecR family protein n=1 Tax=Sunxiuqinia rutila TaxID=1397841 RepID=UPI003D36D623